MIHGYKQDCDYMWMSDLALIAVSKFISVPMSAGKTPFLGSLWESGKWRWVPKVKSLRSSLIFPCSFSVLLPWRKELRFAIFTSCLGCCKLPCWRPAPGCRLCKRKPSLHLGSCTKLWFPRCFGSAWDKEVNLRGITYPVEFPLFWDFTAWFPFKYSWMP